MENREEGTSAQQGPPPPQKRSNGFFSRGNGERIKIFGIDIHWVILLVGLLLVAGIFVFLTATLRQRRRIERTAVRRILADKSAVPLGGPLTRLRILSTGPIDETEEEVGNGESFKLSRVMHHPTLRVKPMIDMTDRDRVGNIAGTNRQHFSFVGTNQTFTPAEHNIVLYKMLTRLRYVDNYNDPIEWVEVREYDKWVGPGALADYERILKEQRLNGNASKGTAPPSLPNRLLKVTQRREIRAAMENTFGIDTPGSCKVPFNYVHNNALFELDLSSPSGILYSRICFNFLRDFVRSGMMAKTGTFFKYIQYERETAPNSIEKTLVMGRKTRTPSLVLQKEGLDVDGGSVAEEEEEARNYRIFNDIVPVYQGRRDSFFRLQTWGE